MTKGTERMQLGLPILRWGGYPRPSRWAQSKYMYPFLSRDPYQAGLRMKRKNEEERSEAWEGSQPWRKQPPAKEHKRPLEAAKDKSAFSSRRDITRPTKSRRLMRQECETAVAWKRRSLCGQQYSRCAYRKAGPQPHEEATARSSPTHQSQQVETTQMSIQRNRRTRHAVEHTVEYY